MESLYYNLFRATLKKMLHKYDNYIVRENLLEIINDVNKNLDEKREEVKTIIQELLKTTVAFVKHDKKSVEAIYEMQKCFDKKGDGEDCNVSLCGYWKGQMSIIIS